MLEMFFNVDLNSVSLGIGFPLPSFEFYTAKIDGSTAKVFAKQHNTKFQTHLPH